MTSTMTDDIKPEAEPVLNECERCFKKVPERLFHVRCPQDQTETEYICSDCYYNHPESDGCSDSGDHERTG